MERDPSKGLQVLVTSFGPFLDIKINPTSQIASLLPTNIPNPLNPEESITLIVPEPLKCAYHTILPTITALLETHQPDLIIHLGLAADRNYFAIEKGAEKEGYHEFPDLDRKVWLRSEGKKNWGKAPGRLDSELDLEGALEGWISGAKNRTGVAAHKSHSKGKGKSAGKGGEEVDLRTSDDVGTFVCGFVYYASLEWLWKAGKKRNVVFLHVPPLETGEDVQKGVNITIALVRALVDGLE